MKYNWGKIALSILMLGSALAALAQEAPTRRVSSANLQTASFKVHVPFSFRVGSQTLPAGFYQVQRLMGRPTDSDQSGVVVLRGITVPVYTAVATRLVSLSTSASGHSQLLFGSEPGQHCLSEVRIEGEKGQQIPCISARADLMPSSAQEEVVVAMSL